MLRSVFGWMSSPSFPGIVTRPRFTGCLYCRWLPSRETSFQPSSSTIRTISLTFFGTLTFCPWSGSLRTAELSSPNPLGGNHLAATPRDIARYIAEVRVLGTGGESPGFHERKKPSRTHSARVSCSLPSVPSGVHKIGGWYPLRSTTRRIARCISALAMWRQFQVSRYAQSTYVCRHLISARRSFAVRRHRQLHSNPLIVGANTIAYLAKRIATAGAGLVVLEGGDEPQVNGGWPPANCYPLAKSTI